MTMEADKPYQPQREQIGSPGRVIELAGVVGQTAELLVQGGDLKPYNSWMGITTSKKTYPDEMVLGFTKWASAHSNRFMIVIADGMQVYNQMALKGINPSEMTDKERKWCADEIKDYQRSARKRQVELRALLREAGIENARVRLWSQLLDLFNRDWQDRVVLEAFKQMAYAPGLDPSFDAGIGQVVRERAGHILDRSQANREQSEFVAGLYPREQWALTMTLSSLGIYKYLTKIGPEEEQAYDVMAINAFKNGVGNTFRAYNIGQEGVGDWPFGAIYLRYKPAVSTHVL